MSRLVIHTEGAEVREVLLGPLNTIGRHPSQSIQLLDKLVSKAHATILQEDGKYVVKDVGSRNGTLVNEMKLSQSQSLAKDDEIVMGSTRCIFKEDEGERTRIHRVNISSGDGLQSAMQSMVAQDEACQFLPEAEVDDVQQLRSDYERLRLSHLLREELANELDLDNILEKIFLYLFENMGVDRGAFLLYDKSGELQPRLSRRRPGLDLTGYGDEDEISISRTILSKVVDEKSAIMSNDARVDSRFAGAQSIILQGIRSTICVPLLTHAKEVLGVMHLDNLLESGAFEERDLSIVQGLADQAAMAIETTQLVDEAKGAALTRQSFERLLSPNLVEKVISGELAVNRGGELREVTILFSDIRGFTEMSENQPAPEIVQLLNDYFEAMVEIVFDNNGTLDKFMGDGLMAMWGAPVTGTKDAYEAVCAALEMQAEVSRMNVARVGAGERPIEIGIGIDTGLIVAGYLGSTKTMSYTVVGSAVNRAARLCGIATPGQVLVSETTLECIENDVVAEMLPAVELKGIRGPVSRANIQAVKEKEGKSDRPIGARSRGFTGVGPQS